MTRPSSRAQYFEANGGTLKQVLGFETDEEAEAFEEDEERHEEDAVRAKATRLKERDASLKREAPPDEDSHSVSEPGESSPSGPAAEGGGGSRGDSSGEEGDDHVEDNNDTDIVAARGPKWY